MWPMRGGTLTIDRARVDPSAGPGSVVMPCPSFLIEHPRALVLFDTGLNPAAVDNVEEFYGADLAARMGISFTAEDTLERQFRGSGYLLGDVDVVVL